jgi:rubredoxin
MNKIMETRRIVEYDCYFCDICRKNIYDELKGDPERDVSPKTHVDDLPSDWRCPFCGSRKEKLRACTLLDHFVQEKPSVTATVSVPLASSFKSKSDAGSQH